MEGQYNPQARESLARRVGFKKGWEDNWLNRDTHNPPNCDTVSGRALSRAAVPRRYLTWALKVGNDFRGEIRLGREGGHVNKDWGIEKSLNMFRRKISDVAGILKKVGSRGKSGGSMGQVVGDFGAEKDTVQVVLQENQCHTSLG